MAQAAIQQTLHVDDRHEVSALSLCPPGAKGCFVFAHGAGAGMTHPSMEGVAQALSDVGIATLRYQFPFMQRGSRRPDTPALCHATVRAAVDQAHRLSPSLPLIAGGRSFGGRMTSQAQSEQALPGVVGLAFIGFPLHPAGKPAVDRAQHLASVHLPMLFLQGDRDALAELRLLQPMVDSLQERATLHLIVGGDHSFHVPAKTGRTAGMVQAELAGSMRIWLDSLPGKQQ
jgi:uncharacterized protein